MKYNTCVKQATLCFLKKEKDGKWNEICLAMKKRGFGEGKWNGVGGKVKVGKETIEQAAIREAREEIGVDIKENHLVKGAELAFHFPHNLDSDQVVHVYVASTWEGDPVESEEMSPFWFEIDALPYDSMWPGDSEWIKHVLEDKFVTAETTFGEGDVVLIQNIVPSEIDYR